MSQTTRLHATHKMTPNSWELGQIPREGYPSTVPKATATIHGYPGHNIQRQKPEGMPPTRPCFRGPGAPSRAVHQACHTLGATLKLSLCFQTSVPTAWTHTTSRRGPLEPQRKIVPALSKESVPNPLTTTLEVREKLQAPEAINSGGHPGLRGAL